MKLNFIFILIDLFTLLAYPIVFVHAKLHRFEKPKEGIRLANFFENVPVAPKR
jgi:hypothetical protein